MDQKTATLDPLHIKNLKRLEVEEILAWAKRYRERLIERLKPGGDLTLLVDDAIVYEQINHEIAVRKLENIKKSAIKK